MGTTFRVAARLLLAAVFVAAAPSAAQSGEDEGKAVRITEERALAILHEIVEQHRAGDAEHAWELLDVGAFAQRGLGKWLARASETDRAEVVDLVRRGITAETTRSPMPWAGASIQIHDYRVETHGGDTTTVTFGWRPPDRESDARWGIVLVRTSEAIRIIDLVFGKPGAQELGSTALGQNYKRWGHRVGSLQTFLRYYFRLPLPGTKVPDDAPVDWASPDTLKLGVHAPTIPTAVADGWWAVKPPRGDLLYRQVLHIGADGSVRWRWDVTRWGGAEPLSTGSLVGPTREATLGHFAGPRALAQPVLIRADRDTPWRILRNLLGHMPERARNETAFSVSRTEAGAARTWGQVGLWDDSVCEVAPSRRALEESGGLPRPQHVPATGGQVLPVRITATATASGAQTVLTRVGEGAERIVPPASDAPSRTQALQDLTAEVVRVLGESKAGRVSVLVAHPDGDAVRHGDVIGILAALRAGSPLPVDLELPPAPRRATPPNPHADAGPKLAWKVPAGWVEKPGRGMRVVTIVPAKAQGTDCFVAILRGDAGGWKANVARWHAEMGAPAPSDDDLEHLERWEVLGQKAWFVSATGKHGKIEDARMYGLICPIGSWTVFVKMVGPRSETEPERERFKQFCQSLSQK